MNAPKELANGYPMTVDELALLVEADEAVRFAAAWHRQAQAVAEQALTALARLEAMGAPVAAEERARCEELQARAASAHDLLEAERRAARRWIAASLLPWSEAYEVRDGWLRPTHRLGPERRLSDGEREEALALAWPCGTCLLYLPAGAEPEADHMRLIELALSRPPRPIPAGHGDGAGAWSEPTSAGGVIGCAPSFGE